MASNKYLVRQRISRLGQRMSSFQLNLNPLKEPLGFIKVLEWIAAIFAFATCGGYKGKTEILVKCSPDSENKTVTATFAYPFSGLEVQKQNKLPYHHSVKNHDVKANTAYENSRILLCLPFLSSSVLDIVLGHGFIYVKLNQASFQTPANVNVCNTDWKHYVLLGDYSSSAQFYVTFAVFIFLYCIAALLVYVGYINMYRDNRKLPMIDFVVTLVATFLWLVSTSAWAKALTDIKIATGHNIVQELKPCEKLTCYFGSVTSMGSLNVSVIFGFLNMILWGGNAWFVYKETSLHSPSNTSASHNQGGIPPPSGI